MLAILHFCHCGPLVKKWVEALDGIEALCAIVPICHEEQISEPACTQVGASQACTQVSVGYRLVHAWDAPYGLQQA